MSGIRGHLQVQALQNEQILYDQYISQLSKIVDEPVNTWTDLYIIELIPACLKWRMCCIIESYITKLKIQKTNLHFKELEL